MNAGQQITVQNAQRRLPVELKSLRKFASRALQLCLAITPRSNIGLNELAAVHVALVSDSRMASLHKKFMNIDEPTDVLTFQHGEIVISVETAQQNAVCFRTTVEHELRLYLVHGLLHLHGFDDTDAASAAVMSSLQSEIVAAAAV